MTNRTPDFWSSLPPVLMQPGTQSLTKLTDRIDAIPRSVLMPYLVYSAPAGAVKALREQFRMNGYNGLGYTSDRDAVYNAIPKRLALKGSVALMREIFIYAGVGGSEIFCATDPALPTPLVEYFREGPMHEWPDSVRWAIYFLRIPTAITVAAGIELRRVLENFAPARDYFAGGIFADAGQHHYDNTISYDGTWPHGGI